MIFLFALVLLLALAMIPVGLPGTWVMVAAAVGLGFASPAVHVGWVVIALVAAALEANAIGSVELRGPITSLQQVIDENATVEQKPELFCFGLLEALASSSDRVGVFRPVVRSGGAADEAGEHRAERPGDEARSRIARLVVGRAEEQGRGAERIR